MPTRARGDEVAAKSSLLAPEVLLSTRATSTRISRAVAAGLLRKIGPRLYTPRIAEAPAAVIRRNRWDVVGLLFPGAVISHRSALSLEPETDGSVFLTGRYSRVLRLPALTIRVVAGPGPLDGDARHTGGLWLASRPRAFLENLSLSRKRGGVSRVLARTEIEDRLERLLQISGEPALNGLRDAARSLAPKLGAQRAYKQLSAIVGALLGTQRSRITGPAALARTLGLPYDANRLPRFDALLRELRSWTARDRPARFTKGRPFENEAFFDAYFSNYIEGTRFEVDEAIGIVFSGRVLRNRPEDSHDVLGTFRVLRDPKIIFHSALKEANDVSAFLELLQHHHRVLLGGRPEATPGELKTQPNRAGTTSFVAPELVRGTLGKGLERFRALDSPFARAAFIMFLVAEVHPFVDGNGRLARLMMNAELLAGRQSRIVVPTVFREDYLGALRALTVSGRADVVPRMLDRAQRFTASIDFRDLRKARRALEAAKAFSESKEDSLIVPADE